MNASADVLNAIRAAAANERAAAAHEDKYGNQMRAAGANMYHAFELALRAAPEYQGRKLDERAVLRVYKSTAPRKWWDEALHAAKFFDGKGRPDRDHAKRLLQWHIDPEGAQARRAQHALQVVASRKRVGKARTAAARGSMLTPKAAPTTEEMRGLASSVGGVGGEGGDRGDDREGCGYATPPISISTEDLLGECNRLSSAAKKVEPEHRAQALEVLRVTAREIERYVP